MYSVYKDFLKIGEFKSLEAAGATLGITKQAMRRHESGAALYRCGGHWLVKHGDQHARAIFKAMKFLYLVECCPSPALAEVASDAGLRIIQHQVID